ncbi:MAG TPA: replication-associated recombination protein A, partial [Acidobacteriaceae bacterium]|nr:replication-associated recombination protein A [Acidobacteriaceae bacterium]
MSLFDALPGDPAYSNETPSDLRQRPLAERMRPRTLGEFVGQEHLLGLGKALRLQLETDDTTSMILWGPPGVGKTTLAKIIAHTTKATFIEFSAVVSGIKEIKQVMAEADQAASAGMRTILFVDEIHRFNRSQQDAFLPYVERGAIRLIGATTENPSFELNAALLSRCRVYVLEALSDEQIVALLHRALTDKERGLGGFGITSPDDALQVIAGYSNGDVRRAYNVLEAAVRLAASAGQTSLDGQLIADAVQQKTLLYDKSGEEHYNLISALHKSIRNSDPDAALYWLTRMLRSGEDPMYLARRLVRMASEDIGL